MGCLVATKSSGCLIAIIFRLSGWIGHMQRFQDMFVIARLRSVMYSLGIRVASVDTGDSMVPLEW